MMTGLDAEVMVILSAACHLGDAPEWFTPSERRPIEPATEALTVRSDPSDPIGTIEKRRAERNRLVDEYRVELQAWLIRREAEWRVTMALAVLDEFQKD